MHITSIDAITKFVKSCVHYSILVADLVAEQNKILDAGAAAPKKVVTATKKVVSWSAELME